MKHTGSIVFSFLFLLVLVLLPSASCADSVTGDSSQQDSKREVSLTFSKLTRIDDSHFSKHDPSRLFYFNLYAPGLPGMPEQAFPLHAEGDTQFKVWFDPKVPPYDTPDPSARSLAVQITSTVNAPKKDKIVLALVPDQSEEHLRADAPDNRRFVAFDFMLDPHYEVPFGWALHFQAWQRCNLNPPFTMEALPGKDRMGPVDITFGVRDDIAELKPRHPRKILYTLRLQRGEWHNFIFELMPQSDSSARQGALSIWLDGRKLVSYHGPWGYSPVQPPPVGNVCNDRMALEFGIYRGLQATTQTVYFQNLRYGKSLASVSSRAGPDVQ